MATISGFILAAGEGRRLRPATLVRPKALLPFCGVPLLELAASQLYTLELQGIAVNVSYQGERVYEAAQRLASRKGWDLRLSQEEHLLDTGGGLRCGARLLPDAEHILVHNVDTVLDFDLRRLLRAHLASGALATLLLVPDKGPCTVDTEADGRIRNFRRPHGQGRYTFSGVHIFRRDTLEYLPADPVCSIIRAYEHALASGAPVLGLPVEEQDYWADLGTASQYIRAHGEIADCALRFHPAMQRAQAEQARRRGELELRGVQCTGALGLGIGLGVPAGAHLHNVVLWDYTRLPRPLLYADGIFVGDDVPPAKPVDDDRQPDPRILDALGMQRDQTRVTLLQKQGSGRKYCRLTSGGTSWVWCAYNPERRENAGYAAIADFLRRLGLRVPEVALHLPDACELVSRDLGQHVLVRANGADRAQGLFQVAEQIARLHVLGDQAARLEELPLQRGFTKGLYDWERDYFRQHLLGAFLARPDLWGLAARDYCRLRDALLRQPLVPIHRDLQSANVIMVDGEAFLIDFQGMRLGCAAYDLGALLYDPYQEHLLTPELRRQVWAHYTRAVRELGGTPPPEALLPAAALQRLMQALGAYGKLWLSDGLEWYRPFLLPGLRLMQAAAAEARTYPGIAALARTALDMAMPKLGET
ncbi:MAG: NTP transferase domain-containing protein [Lentisphaeria bacterium]|nr:NTP transferase domain-containing protein [Lentisphaeria bacterium]